MAKKKSFLQWMTVLCALFLLSTAIAACAGSGNTAAAPSKEATPAKAGEPTAAPTAAQPGDTATSAQPPPDFAVPTIPFTIQVGAFSSPDRAADKSAKLQKAGLDAYYFLDTDNLYKVRIDRFATQEEAQHRAAELRKKRLIDTFFIVQPGPVIRNGETITLLRESIIKTAQRFLGKPYLWGGSAHGKGFDCSGLTLTVFRLNGLDLPRNATNQYKAGRPVAREALEPGDLLFFATNRSKEVSHVGIFTGNDQFIHAPSRGKSIQNASLSNSYFKKSYIGACRYF